MLLILLAVTYNVHYAVLSFLCAGLWWAINWFVTELEVADQQEAETKRLQEARGKWQDNQGADDSETETEGGGDQGEGGAPGKRFEGTLRPEDAQGALRKRRSLGEASSGDLSTDSEWDKVEEAEDE